MIIYILLIFFIAFTFYGLIPGIGAFLIRRQWYNFRKRLTNSSLLPILNSSHLGKGENILLGQFRFFGNIESIQGNDRIWLTNNEFSVGADLEKITIYLLTSYPLEIQTDNIEQLESTLPDEEPQCIPWNKIFSLPSGIQIFVSGSLYSDQGRWVFHSEPKSPLLVVIFDGNRETLLKRSIWSARQRNEYYNQFTPFSLISGSLLLILIAFLLIRVPDLSLSIFNFKIEKFPVLLSITLSSFPLLYLFPPGVVFYFLYRYFWKQARFLRAERDLLRLPFRYFPENIQIDSEICTATLPSGEKYIMQKWRPGEKDNKHFLTPDVKIRGSSLSRQEGEEGTFFLFGAYKTNNQIKKPVDPMAELVCIPGNPLELALACNSKSKKLGILSAIFIFTGLIMNHFLLFLIILFLSISSL